MGVCVYFVSFLVIPIPINGIVFGCLNGWFSIFNNIIGGGNRRTRRKQSTCLKSLTLSHKVVHLAFGGS